jgi:ABC-type branched-subunit amino acid transport system permease subunit
MAFVTSFTEYWPMVSGIVIIVVVLVMPGGLLGLLSDKLPFLRKNERSAKETNG